MGNDVEGNRNKNNNSPIFTTAGDAASAASAIKFLCNADLDTFVDKPFLTSWGTLLESQTAQVCKLLCSPYFWSRRNIPLAATTIKDRGVLHLRLLASRDLIPAISIPPLQRSRNPPRYFPVSNILFSFSMMADNTNVWTWGGQM